MGKLKNKKKQVRIITKFDDVDMRTYYQRKFGDLERVWKQS